MLLPCLTFSSLGKSTGVKHRVLPVGQALTVAFIVLAQLCGLQAIETEMDVATFIKNGEGRTLNLSFDFALQR